MSGIFKPGQLVTSVDWMDSQIDLFAGPSNSAMYDIDRIIGHMVPHDVALVIALTRADGAWVYVMGSHGSGWTPGGFLKLVQEP